MKEMTMDKRKQVADQCRVVAHLATALAQVNSDYAKMFDEGQASDLLEMVGKRTARHMELLGDILNGMDAVTEDDSWIDSIFERAHELWPAATHP